jgi:hypothetical protein
MAADGKHWYYDDATMADPNRGTGKSFISWVLTERN